jgi:hypothetical protein
VTTTYPTGPATVAEVGPMIGGAQVELAVYTTLHDWLPSYLSEYERQNNLTPGSVSPPRGWAVTGRDLAKQPADQLPCVVIMAGGIVDPPRKEGGRGRLTARWVVDVGAVFAAAWGGKSRAHAQQYAVAVRTLLQQRPVLIGDGSSVDWRAEGYDEMDFESERMYSASIANFTLEVVGVGWANGGPPPYVTPPTDPTAPLDPWTAVDTTDVTVERTPTP